MASPVFDRFIAAGKDGITPFVRDAIPAKWAPKVTNGYKAYAPLIHAFHFIELRRFPGFVDYEVMLEKMKTWLRQTPGLKINSTGGLGQDSSMAQNYRVEYEVGSVHGLYSIWLIRGEQTILMAELTEAIP